MPFLSRPSRWQNVSEVMRATWWLVQLGSENSHSVPMDEKAVESESNWGWLKFIATHRPIVIILEFANAGD